MSKKSSTSSKFGYMTIVLYAINSIVGAGIFLLPKKAYIIIGSASLGVIIFNMLLVLSLAFCFAEAAGRFKANGGAYIYAKEAFGEFVGFEVGFMRYVVSTIAWSALAVAFVTVLGSTFHMFLNTTIRNLTVTFIIIGLGAVNYFGVEISKILNNIITFSKLIPLALFVVIGAFFVKFSNYTPIFPEGIYTEGSFASAVVLLLYAFSGFESVPVAAEDMENPEENLPKGLVVGVAIVALIYFSILAVTIGILGPNIVNTSAPLAEAAKVFLGKPGFALITIGSLISIGGINIANSFASPRSLSALANNGMVPVQLGKINKHGTPGAAIILTTIVTLIFALSGSFEKLAALSVLARFAQYIPTCIAVLVFRKKIKTPSKFVIPGGPIIPLIAIAASLWLVSNSSLKDLIYGFGGLLVGIPFYLLAKFRNKIK